MNRMFSLFTFTFLLLVSFQSWAQTTTSIQNASTILSSNIIGSVAWSNPLNALLNDASKTTSTALALGNDTEYLIATGFNFSVPTGMVISGIEVDIVKSATNGISYNVTDNQVRIVKAGVVTGTNLASPTTWAGTDQTVTYGSSTSKWGTTWTVADINDPGFGIAISAHLAGLLLPTARVNAISISVSYDIAPLPVSMISFDAQGENKLVYLSWGTASENNNYGFTIQRSSNGRDWINLGEVRSLSPNSTNVNTYSYTDAFPQTGGNYYRLLQTDVDQKTFSYSNIEWVELKAENEISLYPNPAHDMIHVAYAGNDEVLEIPVTLSDLTGRTIQTYALPLNENSLSISTTELPSGEYLLSMVVKEEVIYKRVVVGH
ncbi:MAG: hypothetical protein JWO58_87 [Chitinophagaceae bacterium]|nr:hypothetical protein [Chitinophagaceae bacterium]